ncbi:MAG: inosine/xanthosine triphosphatase [Ekhidna sp.]|nr:inosine/xanthosine triphosphatase [Ekhidna sp.]
MKIIVASRNPVKIQSTEIGFAQVFPSQRIEIQGIDAPSGVSDQPMTNEETLVGAKNRALFAQSHQSDADYWVGIEGGIEETHDGMEVFAWVVILSNSKSGQSRTSTFYLPSKVAELVGNGVELGEANDQVFSEINSKQKGGAVGSLTNGLLGRTEYYVQPVILALIPHIQQELY